MELIGVNVLIVYAHPNPRSFNAAMRTVAVDTLTEVGHAVQVSDLYAMHFKPTLDERDFKERQKPDFFDPLIEQYHAAVSRTFAEDIAKEVDKVEWANLIIFQFPLWWMSFPAILKGWCDRVFANGVAVNMGTYDPLFVGKKALCALTTGSGEAMYAPEGPAQDINVLLTFARGMFRTAGIEFLEPFIAFGVPGLTSDERAQALQRYRERLQSL
ncbi:MAG TPA: NAD(P)H-dependent oxidoreductase [Candidatus Bathyarchaeia archaeon]|nr:NAD(P)H-dependent oxidoreductase [Candidatus Bathyarchaeia archaeon]